MDIVLTPIGWIHSPFTSADETPIQSARSSVEGWVEVFPEYAEGLQDIEAFSHLYLIYHLHRATQIQLQVEPFLDDSTHGVFSTRHPFRPNHLGISIVELLARKENQLRIRGVDVFDLTPLLDIKPYVPDFDHRQHVRSGWYEKRSRA